MLKMRHLPRQNPDYDTSTYTLGSDEYEVCSCPSRADMPRTAGRMGFSGSRPRNFDGKAQNQGPGKMAKYICVGAPLLILCVLVGRLNFAKNGFLKIDKFSLKPLKRSAQRSRFENPFLHGRVWNRPSLKWQQHRADIFLLRLALPVAFTLKTTRWIVLFFLLPFSFSLPQLPFHIFLVAFSSAITTYIFPFCFVWVSLFLLVVLVFLLVSRLLIWLHHSCFSLDFCLVVLFVLFSLYFFAFCVFSSCCLSYPLPVFSSSSVSFCDSPLSCSSVSFSPLFSFCISFDFFSALCFFSLFFLFLIFCVFFSPGPRVRLKRKTNEKNNFLILFAFRGSLWKCPLRKVIFFTFLVDFLLFTEHVFVRYSLIMFWGSKGLSVAAYLLLYRCFGVWWRAFFLSNLSLVPTFLGFVLFCVRVFFFWGGGVLLLFSSFVEVYFFLGLFSSSWVVVTSLPLVVLVF